MIHSAAARSALVAARYWKMCPTRGFSFSKNLSLSMSTNSTSMGSKMTQGKQKARDLSSVAVATDSIPDYYEEWQEFHGNVKRSNKTSIQFGDKSSIANGLSMSTVAASAVGLVEDGACAVTGSDFAELNQPFPSIVISEDGLQPMGR